ncbi:MAG: DUF6179 domain-containing protein [Lachnospiraceae bacterium]|nr:DUF6179 domain-containing protein [Lachnospiraceae bacterium]
MKYQMKDLIPIVAELTEKYTCKESTSITYEKAEQFMSAVQYCLREYEQRDKTEKLMAKQSTAQDAYQYGYNLVLKKVEEALEIYHEILDTFQTYDNRCLEETVQKGIPEFFKWYDARFYPQNTILTLDYPVMKDIWKLCGIDAIYEFLMCIKLEQKFLNHFDTEIIYGILKDYHQDYKDMLENICRIVWENVIFHTILGKKMESPFLEETDKNRVTLYFLTNTQETIETDISGFTKRFVKQYFEQDMELQNYLQLITSDLIIRMRHRTI